MLVFGISILIHMNILSDMNILRVYLIFEMIILTN